MLLASGEVSAQVSEREDTFGYWDDMNEFVTGGYVQIPSKDLRYQDILSISPIS